MTVFCHLYGSDKGRIQFMPGMSGYRAGLTEEKTWALALGDNLVVMLNRQQVEKLADVVSAMDSAIEAEETAALNAELDAEEMTYVQAEVG